jgi:hypothetical protein
MYQYPYSFKRQHVSGVGFTSYMLKIRFLMACSIKHQQTMF